MSNLLTHTEDFSHPDWALTSATVTANTWAAPTTAAVGAGMADTVEDASAVDLGYIQNVPKTITSDSSAWLASVYIRKEAARTSDFPELYLSMTGGTTILAGIAFNPTSGVIGFPSGGFVDASGVVNVDTDWWRVWWRKANNNSGNVSIVLRVYPAMDHVFESGPDASAVGTLTVWGANLTNTSTVQTYEPDPAYAVSTTPPMILIQHV